MPYADPEKAREYNRIYDTRRRKKHPELNAARARKYRKRHPEKARESSKRWRDAHPGAMHSLCSIWEKAHWADRVKYHRERRNALRETITKEYGGKCAICDETDFHKLTLDHSFGDGGVFRKQFRLKGKTMSGCHFYAWLKRKGFPKNLGLRVLCSSCNTKEWNKQKKRADHNTHVESEEVV